MMTRWHFAPAYSATQPKQMTAVGTIRSETIDGIPQTWAISRPVSSPQPVGAPHYLGTSKAQRAPGSYVQRSGAPSLKMNLPKLEMDPSDSRTWQRTYLFTH
jgi:hypothetical protein